MLMIREKNSMIMWILLIGDMKSLSMFSLINLICDIDYQALYHFSVLPCFSKRKITRITYPNRRISPADLSFCCSHYIASQTQIDWNTAISITSDIWIQNPLWRDVLLLATHLILLLEMDVMAWLICRDVRMLFWNFWACWYWSEFYAYFWPL